MYNSNTIKKCLFNVTQLESIENNENSLDILNKFIQEENIGNKNIVELIESDLKITKIGTKNDSNLG